MVTRRLKRIFGEDGKAFVVACDHGMINGPMEGIMDMEDTLRSVIEGGADGIMATYGTVRRYPEIMAKTGLVLRIDGAASVQCPVEGAGDAFYSVDDALRLGAEALCVTTFTWTKWEEHMLKVLAETIRKGHEWGIPIMAEMMPGGFGAAPEFRSIEAISHAARVAAELGADWVKVPYCDTFEKVVASSYVPVVVLGGANDPDKRKTLEMVKQGMDAGASGATIGRNIWQSRDTKKMTAAVRALVHEGANVDGAMDILQGL
jgi:fructose-bisphosphate aldolase, class I